MYAKAVKRILDFISAAALLVLLSWLFLILAILIASRLGTPVIFRQERPGRISPRTGAPRVFTVYKFRTMTDSRDGSGNLKADAERLTPFGEKLRRASLDELPELVNILKGDMSFVGPRPLLVQYLPRYSAEQARRHEVRPGLTGLAQVNGRNAITWEEKFAYDVRYVDTLSFAGDCRIIAATFSAVTKREGISAEGAATMPEFLGTYGAAPARETDGAEVAKGAEVADSAEVTEGVEETDGAKNATSVNNKNQDN